MLDLNTFGKTPAALYLADRLNTINNPKHTRKISKIINNTQAIINQSIQANISGILEIYTLNFIVSSLRLKVKNMSDDLMMEEGSDKLSVDLMSNILIGELKSISRKTEIVKLLKQEQNQMMNVIKNSEMMEYELDWRVDDISLVKCKLEKKSLSISHVIDNKTAEHLINKSKNKLARKGKQNTLYK